MTSAVAALLGSTTIPPHVAARIIAEIAADDEFWDGHRSVSHTFHAHLAGIVWHWPWYDDWKLKFAEIGAFPRMWQPGADRDRGKIERELGAHDMRVWLLSRTAAGLHYSHQRLRRGSRLTPLEWCRLSPIGDEPPPIAAMIEALVQAYRDGRPGSALPPYFPGDRTDWSPCLPPHSRRRVDGICPFHGGLPFFAV